MKELKRRYELMERATRLNWLIQKTKSSIEVRHKLLDGFTKINCIDIQGYDCIYCQVYGEDENKNYMCIREKFADDIEGCFTYKELEEFLIYLEKCYFKK